MPEHHIAGKRSCIKIIIEEGKDAQQLAELSHIIINLRYWSKLWHEHFGSNYRTKMMHWEDKIDEWIEKHSEVIYTDNP